MKLPIVVTLLGAAAVASLSTPVLSQTPPEGSRYFGLPRYYKSEISVTEAYLAMKHSQGFREKADEPKAVLIDNRSLREYASGHPEYAYNVPFPTVSGLGGDAPQDPLKLYWEVYRIVDGRMDTPIMTLCRTGIRSVFAGNILANPESNDATKGRGLQPFTNVRNIWEGFVGQPKYAYQVNSPALQLAPTCPLGCQLDLNKDGVVSADAADVFTQTRDANPDKDGWRNFAGLPWTSKIRVRLAYERNRDHYSALNLTPIP